MSKPPLTLEQRLTRVARKAALDAAPTFEEFEAQARLDPAALKRKHVQDALPFAAAYHAMTLFGANRELANRIGLLTEREGEQHYSLPKGDLEREQLDLHRLAGRIRSAHAVRRAALEGHFQSVLRDVVGEDASSTAMASHAMQEFTQVKRRLRSVVEDLHEPPRRPDLEGLPPKDVDAIIMAAKRELPPAVAPQKAIQIAWELLTKMHFQKDRARERLDRLNHRILVKEEAIDSLEGAPDVQVQAEHDEYGELRDKLENLTLRHFRNYSDAIRFVELLDQTALYVRQQLARKPPA